MANELYGLEISHLLQCFYSFDHDRHSTFYFMRDLFRLDPHQIQDVLMSGFLFTEALKSKTLWFLILMAMCIFYTMMGMTAMHSFF